MLFSSEQVSAGHPDKLCDQISDAILTDCLSNDHQSRVAIETMIKDNHVTVAGELNWFTGYWLHGSRRSGTTLT